MKQIKAANATG